MSAPDALTSNLFNSILWSWNYVGIDSDTGRTIRASGQFLSDIDPDSEDFYPIQRIQGSRNRVRIDGLWPAGEGHSRQHRSDHRRALQRRQPDPAER